MSTGNFIASDKDLKEAGKRKNGWAERFLANLSIATSRNDRSKARASNNTITIERLVSSNGFSLARTLVTLSARPDDADDTLQNHYRRQRC